MQFNPSLRQNRRQFKQFKVINTEGERRWRHSQSTRMRETNSVGGSEQTITRLLLTALRDTTISLIVSEGSTLSNASLLLLMLWTRLSPPAPGSACRRQARI